jgi:sRNA-binding carbon storage regulator CsrA
MLVIEPKYNQNIFLRDTVSGAVIVVKAFRRKCGNIALGFDAPQTVRITKDTRNENKDCVKICSI